MKNLIVFLVSVMLAIMAVSTVNAQVSDEEIKALNEHVQLIEETKALDEYIQLLETITPSRVTIEEGGKDGLISGSKFYQGDVVISFDEYYLPKDSIHFSISITIREEKVFHVLLKVENIVVGYFPGEQLSITDMETGGRYSKVPEGCWFVLHSIVNGDCVIKPWDN